MDQRLLDAAKLGDVVELQNILKEDPLVLEEVSVIPFAQTPLHVAVLAGKDDFVKEIIKLMPSFAKEINRKSLSPMHIACAKGYSKIASDLLKLKLDVNLCLIKDKHGRTPLHYAIIKGKVDVIEMLISAYPLSLEEVTARDETVLHLAVKGNHFEALKVLIGSIERLKEPDRFNKLFCAKDKEGNTASKLAEARKQREVQDLLKEKGITGAGNATVSNITEEDGDATNEDKEIENRLPVLSQNQVKNKTDMNMMSESAASGNDTKIAIDPEPVDDESKRQTSTVPIKQRTQERQMITSSTEDLSIEMKNVILIVATLLATVTYQAGLSPPPTIWKQGAELDTSCLFKKPYKYLFLPIPLRECPAANFYLFMIGNTAGFTISLSMIFYSSPAHKMIRFALLLILLILIQTYFSLIVSLSQDILSFFVIWLLGPMIFVFFILINTALYNFLYNKINRKLQSEILPTIKSGKFSLCPVSQLGALTSPTKESQDLVPPR